MNEDLVLSQSTISNRTLTKLIGTLAFTLLTIVSAHIRIPLPFTPVPMTLQTFVVPLAGGFLGVAFGSLSMLLYLALGLLGLNVFASATPGLALYLSPTAGYLIAYVFAAAIVGAARNSRSWLLFLAIVSSHVFIFVCGVLGLMWNASMTLPEAFAKGVAPFVVGDALKIVASFLVLISVKGSHARRS
jgi:biotin transport system substrate-specific component